MVEKTKLLIEYINKHLEIPYSQIAKIAKVSVSSICAHSFSFEPANRIVESLKKNRPNLIDSFNEFYEWGYFK